MTRAAFLGAVLVPVLLSSACSLENTHESGGGVKIILKDSEGELRQTAQYFSSKLMNMPKVQAEPASMAEFNCFAVNITGPGISAFSDKLKNCTSPDGFNGHGLGVVSDLKRRGEPIEVRVPGGANRTIDVYGVFPTPDECGGGHSGGGSSNLPYEKEGNGGGFLLGSIVRSIAADTTLTVPVSYGLGPRSITCPGNSMQVTSLFPNGSLISGTSIRIRGINFVPGTSVRLQQGGSSFPCSITSLTSTQINCNTGTLGGTGPADLIVSNPDGQQQYFTGAYNVVSAGGTGHLSISPAVQIDFGNQAVNGGAKSITVEVMNYGSTSYSTVGSMIPPFSFTAGAAPFSTQCGGTIASGATCTFTIEFNPSTFGPVSQSYTSGGGSTNFTIQMTGNGF